MRRRVKGWVPVSDVLGNVWTWGVRETRAASKRAFMETSMGVTWGEYQRLYGWRIARCVVSISETTPKRPPRRAGRK